MRFGCLQWSRGQGRGGHGGCQASMGSIPALMRLDQADFEPVVRGRRSLVLRSHGRWLMERAVGLSRSSSSFFGFGIWVRIGFGTFSLCRLNLVLHWTRRLGLRQYSRTWLLCIARQASIAFFYLLFVFGPPSSTPWSWVFDVARPIWASSSLGPRNSGASYSYPIPTLATVATN